MTDVVSKETRSRMMSGIKAKNTKPEMMIRKGLFRRGLRYRLHTKDLPGKPDLVLPRFKAIIFIHGCFWHRHNCHLFKWPKSNADFWREKILSNVKRDENNRAVLLDDGWRVLTVWECAVKNKNADQIEELIDKINTWILSDSHELQLP